MAHPICVLTGSWLWLGKGGWNLMRISGRPEGINRPGKSTMNGEFGNRQDKMSTFRHPRSARKAERRGAVLPLELALGHEGEALSAPQATTRSSRWFGLVRLPNGLGVREGCLSEVDAGGRRVAYWEGLAACQESGEHHFSVEAQVARKMAHLGLLLLPLTPRGDPLWPGD